MAAAWKWWQWEMTPMGNDITAIFCQMRFFGFY